MDADDAAAIALRALVFLATDADRLSRFLALTGLGPGDLKANIGEPGFQASILDYLLSDESLLLVFAAEAGLAPEQIAPAAELLARQ